MGEAVTITRCMRDRAAVASAWDLTASPQIFKINLIIAPGTLSSGAKQF
jgi:hypothetical protein